MVSHCPACDHTMVVRRLECPHCQTSVEGRFPFDFLALEPEEAGFARAFLMARGNLRELERTLGLSYQALRSRLDAVTERLGRTAVFRAPAQTGEGAVHRGRDSSEQDRVQGVLEALEGGSIDVEQALERLRSGPRTR